VAIPSRSSSVSNIHSDDVVFRPDAHLPKHNPSGRRELFVRTPISVKKLRIVQDCICPDVMANRPDALQSSRRSQCSSASIWTTWLYRLDAIQCLTSIRVSASRHSYGKTIATVRTMCDPVRMMSFIRQVVHTNFDRPDVSLQSLDAPSLIVVITCSRSATVRTLGKHRPDVALLWKLSVLFWKGSCNLPSGRSVKLFGHPPVFWS
jgi:hypothetical protein